jgi:hypothetical protein
MYFYLVYYFHLKRPLIDDCNEIGIICGFHLNRPPADDLDENGLSL